jgi:hypothetical protein
MNFQGENPEAYESHPYLRTRGNNINFRRKSRKKSHIGESVFERSGKSKAQALWQFEIVKPRGRSGAFDFSDQS